MLCDLTPHMHMHMHMHIHVHVDMHMCSVTPHRYTDLASFYKLDLTLVGRLETPPDGAELQAVPSSFSDRFFNFAFLEPFSLSLWLAIGVGAFVIGAIERYVNGKFEARHLSNTAVLVSRVAERRGAEQLVDCGSVTLRAEWLRGDGHAKHQEDSSGVLRVTLVRGCGLLAQDKGGTSDPYGVLRHGPHAHESKVSCLALLRNRSD